MQINLPDIKDLKKVESKNLPETSGVYFIFDSNEVLIYVGESINIKKRMLKHWSATAWYRLEAKTFSFAYIPETELEMSRQRAEIIYKTYYNPKNNHTKWEKW